VKQYIIRISIITTVACILLFTGLGFLLVRQQQNSLYRELVDSRRVSVNYLVNNAVMPLLDDDALSLNSLLKEVKAVDGLVYAMIIDQKGIIRAHTDVSKLGSAFGGLENIRNRRQEGETLYTTYSLPSRAQILDISRPVMFMKRELGWVHLGVSSDFMRSRLAEHKTKAIRTLLLWGSAMLVVLIMGAVLLSARLARSEPLLLRKPKKQNLWEPSSQGTFQQTGGADHVNGGLKDLEDDETGGPAQDMMRNQVTVLFAGIKGFKAYAQTREPAKLMEDLNEYVSIATECILKYGGYIDKFIGDAVIAVFASSPLEANHAERAINAGVDMQSAFHNSLRGENQLLSRVGIGISSGIVLSGTIGPEVKKELTFIGESFKVAYSLNVMAGPGEIIVSRDAYQLLKNRISVEPLPPREMMQRTQSWENFRFIKKK
jgi:adenylate cyclase